MSTHATAPATPKTPAQHRRIFGLAHERGLDLAELHTLAEEETGEASIRKLDFEQANKLIVRLGGDAISAHGYGWCDAKGTPRRTVQDRRKRAGVVRVVSPAQLDLLADLASRRGISVEGLKSLFTHMRVPYPPRTTKDANKVIEALKAMNKRGEAACQ